MDAIKSISYYFLNQANLFSKANFFSNLFILDYEGKNPSRSIYSIVEAFLSIQEACILS